MKKRTSLPFLTVFVLLAALFAAPAIALAATYQTVSGTFRYGEAHKVLTLVNQIRANNGLPALIMTQNLTDAAMKRAAECVVRWDPNNHIRPNGQYAETAWDWDGYASENIQKGATSPSAAVNSWMNSARHKKNILTSKGGFIGIGCFQYGTTLYWVQAFSDSTTSGTDTRSSNLSATVKVSKTKGVDSIVTIGGSGGGGGGGGGGTTPTTYKVRFDRNFGSGGSVLVQTIARNKATALAKNPYTRSGYYFLGWAKTPNGPVVYNNGQAVKNLAAAGGTATLYGRWAKKYCKVVFHANDGSGRTYSQNLPYGKVVRLAKNRFGVRGYVFLGWAKSSAGKIAYKNGAKMLNKRASGATLHVYARWARRYCRVTFKANGGKGRMGVQNLPYLKVVRLAKNKFTRKGYRFAGWALSPTGKVEFKNAEAVRNERASGIPLTLYARWKRVAKSAAKAARPAPAAPAPATGAERVFSVDDCGVFAVGTYEMAVLPDEPTLEELADREEAEALANPIAVTFQVPEGGVAWQFWSAESGILAEDAVTSSTIALELPDLGLWHWLRFFDEEGATLSSTWFFPAAAE